MLLKVISGSYLYELIYTVKIIIGSGLLLRDEAFLESRQTTIDIMLQISLQAKHICFEASHIHCHD